MSYFVHIFVHILCIFCIFYILICIFLCIFFTYYLHILLHIVLHILHIIHIIWHMSLLFIFWISQSSSHHCFVPQLRAQLFTYHHLQPSLLSFPLSKEVSVKSAASLRISYGIVPVLPTGTRGNLPSMEDTGITYKTCFDSRRSYTMVDWHASNHAAQQ